jgi:hypothetical protein
MKRCSLAILCSLLLMSSVEGAKPAVSKKLTAEPMTPKALTLPELNALLAKELPGGQAIDDELFIRRVYLDVIGRPPTMSERADFLADKNAQRRTKLIDRLLDSPEFGKNWAVYWSDTISFHVPPPELTFLKYDDFKAWLAGKFNDDAGWDATVREILSASGKLKDNPAATFVGFHQGRPAKLAAETARVFLGLQLQCAECHDHKFDHWKREEFHALAAFFARTECKLPWNSADNAVVKDKGKGEYTMPPAFDPRKKGTLMQPVFLTGDTLDDGKNDSERRTFLAEKLTRPDSPWLAKAYVNRVWARLMGRGFFDPVDNMADYQQHLFPKVHLALAAHFTANGFKTKDLYRLILTSEAYQSALPLGKKLGEKPAVVMAPRKLSGDEVFESLVRAIGLPNVTPPAQKAPPGVRFPPPPKSTRDLVYDRFAYDTSLCPEEVSRNMNQAMFMMNNDQVAAQIKAGAESGTLLAKLLAAESDDKKAVEQLFEQVLARRASDKEVQIALEHIRSVGSRGEGFEDLLWSLINTAEFTTRR